jgi:hypothetical protein
MSLPDQEIRAIRSKLFGSGNLVQVPGTFLWLLHANGLTEAAPVADFTDFGKSIYIACWLKDRMFCRLTYAGEGADASAKSEVYPLSRLVAVNADYSLRYDDFMRKHDQWNRTVTLKFLDSEPISLNAGDQMHATARSEFIDAVLSALADS